MKIRSRARRRVCLVSAGAVALMAVGAATASAAQITSVYPYQTNASNFATDQGGWSAEITLKGICLFGGGITCPNITPTYVGSGGADGPTDGFLHVGVASIAAVASEARGIWHSPPFLYKGARGHDPEKLTFSITRQANVEDYLTLGNTANYSVELVNTNTQRALTLIDEETLAGAKTWAQVQSVVLDPQDLRSGVKYRIDIIAHFVSLAALFPDSSADFDNVVLKATRPSGKPVNNVTDSELGKLLQPLGPKSATLHKKHLRARVFCPHGAPQPCQIQVSALLSRGGPKVTATRDVQLKPGGSRVIGLVVKDQYLQKLMKRKKAVLRERVRVGSANSTVYKNIRVRIK
jgi:hypothetical protein